MAAEARLVPKEIASQTQALEGVLDVLKTLSQPQTQKLYASPHSCRAIMKAVSPLSRFLLFRFQPLNCPVVQNTVAMWFDDMQMLETALNPLISIRLINRSTIIKGNATVCRYRLNPVFQKTLFNNLGQIDAGWDLADAAPEDNLAEWSKSMWSEGKQNLSAQLTILDDILQHLAGVSSNRTKLSPHVSAIFSKNSPKLRSKITIQGYRSMWITQFLTRFSFLLKDSVEQIWTFLKDYINRPGTEDESSILRLLFLFELSLDATNVPHPISCVASTIPSKDLEIFHAIGLVKIASNKNSFVSTPMAKALFSSSSEKMGSASIDQVIVETNFKVYSYTTSRLHVAILKTFADITYILPNLVVSYVSRDSVFKALRVGITAKQIVRFLSLHAHKRVLDAGADPIPLNVSDQIHLWEGERKRVSSSDGLLIDGFTGFEEFKDAAKFSRNAGILKWFSRDALVLLLHPGSEATFQQFLSKL